MMTLKTFFTLCLLATCTISGILISVITGSAVAAAQPERVPSSKGQATGYSVDKGLSLYKAKEGLYQPQREAFASVRPVSQSLLSAPFVLKIEKIFKDQGSVVKKGEAIASISSPALSKMISQWEQALDQVKLAQDALELVSLKRKSVLATKTDLIVAKLRLSAEREELNTVQARLIEALLRLGHISQRDFDSKRFRALELQVSAKDHYFKIVSPIDGVIEKRFVSADETVTKDAPLFSIQDVSRLVVEANVPCRQVHLWLEGKVFVEKGDSAPLSLLSSKAVLNPETGLCRLSYLEENPQGVLLPYEITRLRLVSAPVPCVYVPVNAVVSRNGKDYCMVKGPSALKAVAVKTGRVSNGMIAILKGLSPGDNVVTENAYELLYRDINELMKFED